MTIRRINPNLTFSQKVRFAAERQQRENENSSVTNNVCVKYAIPEAGTKPQSSSLPNWLVELLSPKVIKYGIPEAQNSGNSGKTNNDITNDMIFMKYAIPRA